MPDRENYHCREESEIGRVNVLGVEISDVNMDKALHQIDRWIERREQNYVCVTPVHSIVQCLGDVELQKIYNNSGMTTPDGMPVVWICRLLGHHEIQRVYGPDLMLAVCATAKTKAYRHYFLGGGEGVVEALIGRLKVQYPELQVAGSYSPPFRELTTAEESAMIAEINEAKPDIVWVGLGAPKQERWMSAQISRLEAPVLIGVGAAFDMHAGRIRQAPTWMRRNGLEWVWRLILEPRRLWRRYAVSNSLFLFHICLQLLKIKKYQPLR